jgi:hypothetical protein
MQVANKSIDFALFGMEKWITNGNWEHGFGTMFLGFRDAMQKYYLRLTGPSYSASCSPPQRDSYADSAECIACVYQGEA